MARGKQDTPKDPNASQREFLRVQEEILKKTGSTEKVQRRFSKWTQEVSSFQQDILGTVTNELDKKIEIMKVTRQVGETLATNFTHNQEILESSRAILENTDDYVKSLQGASDFVDRVTGSIPLISEAMQQSMADTVKNFFAPQIEWWNDLQAKALKIWKSWGMGAKMGLVAVALAFVGVWKIFKELDEALEDFMHTLGSTRKEANQLEDMALNTYTNYAKYGVSLSESLDITQAIVEEQGHMADISQELISQAAIMAQAFGMSSTEAAILVDLQKEALGLTDAQIINNAKMVKATAQIYNVGAGRVARDLADSAEEVALFSGAGMENLIESAAYARRLGVTFKEIATIAESLLDIESSTSAAMQVQMLTGRTINLSQARSMALNGDIQGANENILNQLGSHAELSQADYFTKKAISELLGTDAKTWLSMKNDQEQILNISKDTKKIYDSYLGVSLAEALDVSETLGRLGKLKAQLTSIFKPILLPLVKGFNFFLDVLINITDAINRAQDGWGEWSKGLANSAISLVGISASIFVLYKGFKLMSKLSIFGKLAKGAASGGGLISKGLGLGKGMAGTMLKGALGLAALGVALILVGKGVQMFADVGIDQVLVMTAALVGLGVAGALLGTVSGLAIAGAVGLAALGAALWVVGKGMQQLANVNADQLSAMIVPLLKLGAVGVLLGAFALPALLGAAALAALGVALTITSIAAERFSKAIFLTPAEGITRLVQMQKDIDMSHMKSELESVVDPIRELNKEFSELNTNILKLSKMKTKDIFGGSKGGRSSQTIRQPIKLEVKLDKYTIAKAMETVILEGN